MREAVLFHCQWLLRATSIYGDRRYRKCWFSVGQEIMVVMEQSSHDISTRGVLVSVWFGLLTAISFAGMLRLQWEILQKSRIDQAAWFNESPSNPELRLPALTRVISKAEWLVDGLLGTGLSRPVDGVLHSVIELMNCSGKPIFALDVPSGLDADTGQPLGVAVQATATATFVAPKLGFSIPGTSKYTGQVAVIDIGLPGRLLEPFRES